MVSRLRYILFTLVALMGFAGNAQINTDQVMRIGQNALYFEDYILSIQYFNQVIKAKPYLADPYFFRAIAKISLDDYQGAIDDATLCLERNPFVTDAYQVRAVANMNLNNYDKALADNIKGLEALPENTPFLFNKAMCQVQLKQYEGADSTFAILRRFDPKNERVYLGMCQLDAARGDSAKALDDVNKSLSMKKKSSMGYAMRAELYMRYKKDFESALHDMDTLIVMEPKDANNYINRAWIKYKLDDYFGTMSDYDYAVSLDPQNTAAIYNRALLNAELGEDTKAIADLTTVLKDEPDNFLALYNRAQLYLRSQQFRKAVRDYDKILKKYPRFESGYMARASAKQHLGDMAGAQRDNETAIAIFKKKGIRVATYNPADMEAKAAQKKMEQEIEDARNGIKQPENEEEIIKKFNTLLTVQNDNDLKPEYDNKSRGHIQDRNVEIDPMPMFLLSYYSVVNKLNGKTHYMKEITEVNETHLLPKLLVLSSDEVLLNEEEIHKRFSSIEYYNGMLSTSTPRVIDYFARAVDFMMVKDPESAIGDANRAVKMNPKFALAYFLRADAHYMQYQLERKKAEEKNSEPTKKDDAQAAAMLHRNSNNEHLTAMIEDLNEMLKLSPKNVYAIYNRGNAYLLMNDYTSAISCFNEAINLKPDLGEAYYNRGLMYLKLGNREKGVADLSKAGELGILPSYNVLKRMSR